MAGEKLKGYEGKVGVRDAGRADLSGFSRAAGFMERSAEHLKQVHNAAFSIAKEKRLIEAEAAYEGETFQRDEDGEIVAPVLPEAGPLGRTIYEEAYNKGMLLRYRNEAIADANVEAVRLRAENRNNPDKYKEQWEAYVDKRSADIPQDIRGSIVDQMNRNSDAQYNSLVTSKAAADFQAAKETQTKLIDKVGRDIVMALSNESGIESDKGDQLIASYTTHLSEYADTFVDGSLEDKAAWVAEQARSMQLRIADAGLTHNILTDAMGGNRSMNAEQYAGTLEYISGVEDGTAKISMPVFDEQTQTFTWMNDRLENHFDPDQLAKLAQRMRRVASLGHQLYQAKVNKIGADIEAELSTRLVEISTGDFANYEEAATFAATVMQAEYEAAGQWSPEIEKAVNTATLKLIAAGKSNQAYYRNKLFHKMAAEGYEQTADPGVEALLENIAAEAGVNLEQTKYKDPQLFNSLMGMAETRLAKQNARMSAANKGMTEFGQYLNMITAGTATPNADGSRRSQAEVINDVKNLDQTPWIDNPSKKDRLMAEQYSYGMQNTEEAINARSKMTPEEEADRARGSVSVGVLPPSIRNRFDKLGSINDDESPLPEANFLHILATYKAFRSLSNGQLTLAKELGNKVHAFEMALQNSGNGLDTSLRKYIGDLWTNADSIRKDGLPAFTTRDELDDYITLAKNQVNGFWTDRPMPPEMERQFRRNIGFEAKTAADPSVAVERGFRALKRAGWAYDESFAGDDGTGWVKDPMRSHWAAQESEGFFRSNTFRQMLLDAPAKWNLDFKPEDINDLIAGEDYRVRWLGGVGNEDYNKALIFQVIEHADGTKRYYPVANKNGGTLVINFEKEIDDWKKRQIHQKAYDEENNEAMNLLNINPLWFLEN